MPVTDIWRVAGLWSYAGTRAGPREVDEELDDMAKGRAINDTIKGLSTNKPAETDGEADVEE